MQESRFGFIYSWSDQQPVRPMAYCVVCLQVLGAVCGWTLYETPNDTVMRIWLGGAVVQWRVHSAALSEHARLVRRMGMVTALLSLIAVAILLGVLPANTRQIG